MTVIRQASLSRLKVFSGRENVTLSDLKNEPLVYAHWMSLILLSGKALRIVVKAHYMSYSAKFFAKNVYKRDLSESNVSDFFKEYCNLVAGQIKLDLANNGVDVGMSLPVAARGFDEIFYSNAEGSIVDFWRLSCENKAIDCSAHVELFDDFQLKEGFSIDSNDKGTVEFL